MLDTLQPEDIQRLIDALPTLPRAEAEQLLADLETYDKKQRIQKAKDDFVAFCHYVYPGYKEGPHHRHMRPLLHDVSEGNLLRLTVSMPPRFGKSESIAYLFVAWYLGHHPEHHIMMVTHTAELSADFGRKVRNLIDSQVYRDVFPDTQVSKDKAAAASWATTVGGKYLAIGVGANVAGHGAHCLHPSTRVAGGRTIGDVVTGERLVTKQGRQQVSKKITTKHSYSYILNDDLQASGNHPFYTQRGWVHTEDLVVGDKIETMTIWRNVWDKIRLLHSQLTKRGAA